MGVGGVPHPRVDLAAWFVQVVVGQRVVGEGGREGRDQVLARAPVLDRTQTRKEHLIGPIAPIGSNWREVLSMCPVAFACSGIAYWIVVWYVRATIP